MGSKSSKSLTFDPVTFGLELREHHRHDCELRLGVLDTGSKKQKTAEIYSASQRASSLASVSGRGGLGQPARSGSDGARNLRWAVSTRRGSCEMCSRNALHVELLPNKGYTSQTISDNLNFIHLLNRTGS